MAQLDPLVPGLIQQAGQIQAQQAGVPLEILSQALTGLEKTFKELDRRQEKVDDATMKLLEMKSRLPNLDFQIDPQTNRPVVRMRSPQELAQEAVGQRKAMAEALGVPFVVGGLPAIPPGTAFTGGETPVPVMTETGEIQTPEQRELAGIQRELLSRQVQQPGQQQKAVASAFQSLGLAPEEATQLSALPPSVVNTLLERMTTQPQGPRQLPPGERVKFTERISNLRTDFSRMLQQRRETIVNDVDSLYHGSKINPESSDEWINVIQNAVILENELRRERGQQPVPLSAEDIADIRSISEVLATSTPEQAVQQLGPDRVKALEELFGVKFGQKKRAEAPTQTETRPQIEPTRMQR